MVKRGLIVEGIGVTTDGGARPSGALPDRRRIRGEQTRTDLMEAMSDLIHGGNPRPTSLEVADRAEVSVRLIFYHFHRVETLFRHAAAMQVSRHLVLVAFLPPHGPVDARIRATCHQRRQLFEAIAPMLRVAHSKSLVSPELIELLAGLRSELQRRVELTFGPELASGGPDAPLLLENLDMVTGWQSWDALCYESGRSASAAESVMSDFVTRLLAG